MLTPRLQNMIRKACHAALLAAFGWAGAPLAGIGDAEATPYCLMSKPQLGAPAVCRQFYLADLARADGGARATISPTTGMCAPTPMGQREGWTPDGTFPVPLPSWAAGDQAMGVVSPYHSDLYKCREAQRQGPPTNGGGGPNGGYGHVSSQCSAPGGGCQVKQITRQPESRDAQGRITVEAALIHVLECPSTGTRYVYQYLNRRAFRVVQPGNWSHAIGGGDFATCDQANQVAATSGATTPQQPQQVAGVYVYVLKDIGVVAATQQVVSTRPGCHWAGGGPRPCTTPASVIGALGGPYASEDAARADMRTKLDCSRGHWGTFVGQGPSKAWLQNNITGSDCRSMKQL